MLRKKKTEIEISVEKGNKEITQTGKAMIDQINDPEFKKALIKASSDSDSDVGDPTKGSRYCEMVKNHVCKQCKKPFLCGQEGTEIHDKFCGAVRCPECWEAGVIS